MLQTIRIVLQKKILFLQLLKNKKSKITRH